jgi:hypothetical protein
LEEERTISQTVIGSQLRTNNLLTRRGSGALQKVKEAAIIFQTSAHHGTKFEKITNLHKGKNFHLQESVL